LFSFGQRARADTSALDFSAISNIASNDDWCLGWEFDVLAPFAVTGLGVFDGTGLSPSGHAVGAWDPGGNLIASTTVYPTDPKTGAFFRFSSLTTPVTLTLGAGYVVAAVYPYPWEYGYQFFGEPDGWTVHPNITFIQDRFVASATLQYPTEAFGEVNGWFGGTC